MKVQTPLLLLVVLLFGCVLCQEISNLRGVDPNVLANYKTTSHFHCTDGSQTIPNQHVNDDYCDCADGSDEPGTSACPNARFYCTNAGFLPKSLPSSRVNDRVCDCCDGTDEWQTGVCNNTCKTQGRLYMQSVKRELRNIVKGLERKNSVWLPKIKDIIKQKKNDLHSKQDELSSITTQLSELRTQLSSFQSSKDSAAASKAQLESQYASSATPSPVPEPQPETTTPEADIQDHDEYKEEEQQQDENAGATGEVEYPEEVKEQLREHEEIIERYNKMENEVREVENKEREIKTNVDDINKELSFDYGKDSILLALKGETYEFRDSKYGYTFKPFNEVVQDSSVNLGRWESKENKGIEVGTNGVMKQSYVGGTRCWNGPDRSVVVEFSCGREEKVKEVSEPNKCEYLMKFETSIVCDEERVKELKRTLDGAGEKEEKDDEDWSILRFLTREKQNIN